MVKVMDRLGQLCKMYSNLVLMLLILSLLSGCVGTSMAPSQVGQVYSLQLGSTQWGIARAAQGAIDTFIMSDGNGHYMFSWAVNDAWAFITCKYGSEQCITDDLLRKANLVNATTMSDFVSWLEEHGWKMISFSELPALISQAAAVMPTFIIVPSGSTWDLQQYQDWNGEDWY